MRSRQYSLHHKRGNRAGELLIQALEPKRKLVVVNAETVKNGRIKIAHVHRIFHHVVAIVVGLAMRDAGTYAGSGQPRSETARMMVATIVLLAQPALAVYGAPEFAGPNHQRVTK